VAGGTCALKRKEALSMANLTCAATTTARLWLGTRPRAATGTGLASHGGGDANLRRFAAECLIESNFHVVAQVRSALAPRAAAACGTHAEYAFEDVGKGRAEIGTKSVAAHATMLECSVAESVVGRALVAVLEDVIGLVDFLE